MFLIFTPGCKSQQNKNAKADEEKIIGGGCDGCELMYVDIPKVINSIDTSKGWQEAGQKLLVTGKVFKRDGVTPAAEVIVYYWQTNNDGYYSADATTSEAAKRHGHIRGWLKTDSLGNYALYTIRPGPYPKQNMESHIHLSIKEPQLPNEYYVDELVFDDDILLTAAKRKALENRGGSGVLRILVNDNLQVAEHNIILGLHIPNYPVENKEALIGLQIGDEAPSFTPQHAYGPDEGTKTCPVCKYGRYQGILYFVGNHPDMETIKSWLTFLEAESVTRGKYLKVYFVYANENNFSVEKRKLELEEIGRDLNLRYTALTFVPSVSDETSEINLYKLNKDMESCFLIYKQRNIVAEFANLSATEVNFNLLQNTLDSSKGNYFNLPSLQ